jgi:hypothetical protein
MRIRSAPRRMEMMLLIETDLDAGLQVSRDLLWALMLPHRLRGVN